MHFQLFVADQIKVPGNGLAKEAHLPIASPPPHELETTLGRGTDAGTLEDDIGAYTAGQIRNNLWRCPFFHIERQVRA